MRAATLVVLSVFLLLVAPAGRSAENLVISSGSESGYYHSVARGLRAVLRSQYDTALEIGTSTGSLENLARLDDPASPAAIALTQAARARAFLEGRGFVSPHDIKSVAMNVLQHRVITTYEAEAEEVTSEEVIRRIFDTIEVP